MTNAIEAVRGEEADLSHFRARLAIQETLEAWSALPRMVNGPEVEEAGPTGFPPPVYRFRR
jgi:hypothetical protein